jgi:hypothetical protein
VVLKIVPHLAFMGAMATGVSACDLSPLTREALFAAAGSGFEDAGTAESERSDAANLGAAEAGPIVGDTAPDAGPQTDAVSAPPRCEPASHDGLLSGAVVDKCTGEYLEAQVGIAGRHTCSFVGKGSFFFRDLPTGCVLTLTSAKPGYALFVRELVVPPEGSSVLIELERAASGCTDPPPAPTACRCEQPTCM